MRCVVSNSSAVVVAALSFALLSACPKEPQAVLVDAGPSGGAPPIGAGGAAHDVPGDSAIAKLANEAIILRVNGVEYTKIRLDQAVVQAGMAAGIPPAMLDSASKTAFEKPAYEKLIERQLLVSEAKKRGLLPTLEEAQQATKADRDQLMAKLPPGKTFADMLKEMGTDEAGFNAELPNDVGISRLLQAIEKTVPEASEEALKKVFEDNRARLVMPETTSASHIMVALADGATEAEVKAALDKATALHAEAKGKNKAAFQKLADAKSEDPMVKQTHGDLGSFGRGDMIPDIEDVAFKLKEGELSAPVRSRAGYHVLLGHGTKPARMREYAEVKTILAQREKQRALMEKMNDLIAALRESAKIERVVEPAKSPFEGGGGGMPMPPRGPAPGAPKGAPPVPPAPSPH